MPSSVRIVSATAAAIFLAGGGFAVGRLTATDADANPATCEEPRKLYREYVDSISPDQEVEEQRTDGRMLANTILQNPSCFSTTDRAAAQTILDTIDQGVQEDAINDLRSSVEECVEDATDDYSWSNC
jgi:hypothetical protein